MARVQSYKLKEFKRRAILDAASKVFADKGPEKATMREIAAEAGVTTGAIYPMFDGKDALYAALLAESLERLNAFVTDRANAATTADAKLRASITAFYDYYADRAFEVSLGMHSFGGLKSGSLGASHDEALNSALNKTLDVIASAIHAKSPALSAAQADQERAGVFAVLIGCLHLLHSGRAQSIGSSASSILSFQIDVLTDRLAGISD